MSTSQVSIDRKNYKLTTADGDGDSALINDIRRGEAGGEYSASTDCPGDVRQNLILKMFHLKFRLSDSIIDFSKFG